MPSELELLLTGQLFAWLLVFSRVGTAFMVLPTIGDPYVSTRIRLLLALAVSVVVAPLLAPGLPKQPATVPELLLLLGGEIVYGAFIGTVARILMSSLETAGMIVAIQASLANAFVFNPALATQGSLPGAMMGILGIVLLFVTDLHHLLIGAVVDSYTFFEPGTPLPVDDFADLVTRLVSRSFVTGVQMAAPFLVTGALFALALGLVSRLMPQIQVFFIFMSAQVGLGLLLFSLTLSAMMLFWLRGFEDTLVGILNRT